MSEWILKNRIRPISYEQFIALTKAFKEQAEARYSEEFKLFITFMSGTKEYISIASDSMSETVDAKNRSMVQKQTRSLDDVSEQDWKNAKFVEVNIQTQSTPTQPPKGYGAIEFKGARPKEASFLFLGEHDDVARDLATMSGMRLKLGRSGSNSKMALGQRSMLWAHTVRMLQL